ncbi:MAG TPA: ATPase domain-containing protein [Bryobacteraceae bacterium]|nr:ATPase domain-containing protein [Bryobacteraceae bacterium]
MLEADLVKTGITGFDDILLGGIPRGNVILVEGGIGTGKTTLGVEFVYRGASQFGEPGIIVLFEVSPEKVSRDALRFGWDLAALERQGRLKIVFTTREVLRQELQQADSVLLEEAAKIGARRMFVDGVGRLFGDGNATNESRSAFHVLTEGLQRESLTAVLAVEASSYDDKHRANSMPEESIADTVIRLRMEDSQRAVLRSLEVVKSRGQAYQMGRHTLQILDGNGLRVYRRVQALTQPRDTAATYDPSERISSGIPGLDELVNGGYFVGSTTVVAGISGVGKSVMGIQYIAEGARRGERCIMLSLDERVPQIIRNARSIGVDLQKEIDRGLIHLEYDSPQEIEVDVHFDQIERKVKEFKPTRVVIDSLSTYASTLGTLGRIFRDFFNALTALMKEQKVTTVYNHENPEMLGMATMMGQFAMSSLVDNIILLNWAEIGDTFRLGMTVAKMRANPVNRVTHECEVIDGKGMRVLARELRLLGPQKPFSSFAGLVSRAPERRSFDAPNIREPNTGTIEENIG